MGKDNKVYYCIDCGKKKIGRIKANGEPRFPRCVKCGARHRDNIMESNNHWQGGRIKTDSGYIKVMLLKNSPYISMANSCGYVLEHRLVVAISLGRPLTRNEHTHHKNGIRDDNRIENLELITPSNHILRSQFCANCGLRKEIRILKWQVKELNEQIRQLNLRFMDVHCDNI